MTVTLDLPQIRLLTESYLATQQPTPEGEIGSIPAPIRSLLDQAQAQSGAERYQIELTPSDAQMLAAALEGDLAAAAEAGDLFTMAELQAILSQLAWDETI